MAGCVSAWRNNAETSQKGKFARKKIRAAEVIFIMQTSG
jgi:hypothetical protein